MNIPYTLKKSRKRKKTISLQIGDKSELVIAAPHFTPISEINRFVQEKQSWINKAIQKHKEETVKNKAKTYITGEQFFYLGQAYPLEVFFEPFENPGVFFWSNRFFLNAQESQGYEPHGKLLDIIPSAASRQSRDSTKQFPHTSLRKLQFHDKSLKKYYFVSWYKKAAYKYISERIDFYIKMLNIQPGKLKITSAERRWGSCSEENNLAFSFRLIMAAPEVIDYVVVHELMHIVEKNHSAKFWQLVAEVLPEYKTHRRWLRDNNHLFAL